MTLRKFFIHAVDFVENDSTHEDWIATLKTCGTDVEYKLDSGAQVNILPEHIYKELRVRPKLHRTRVKLTSYSSDCILVKGKVIARIEKGQNKSYPVQFFVVPAKSVPVIGLNTCEKLQLIKRCFLINSMDPRLSDMYESLFDDIGCFQGKYKIKIDPSVTPVIHPPRRVPFALKPQLKAEVQRMPDMGVISKVETPTSWVNSMVCVEKRNGDIRVCIDPRDLDRVIVRDPI